MIHSIDYHTDTIAAQATSVGRGGVGIIRVSGVKSWQISQQLLQTDLKPRHAYFGAFYDENNEVLDSGIALFFPGPNSFTGEDVFEIHAHGGSVILDLMLSRILSLGARQADPGEFSQRAFLNNKLDLVQAEAIADLIDASSEQAARAAVRSMQGGFSKKIKALVESLTLLRIYVESSIDFPEEEIDFLSEGKVGKQLEDLIRQLDEVIIHSKQGVIQKEGMTVVIAGLPNAGKSSLLNALSDSDRAIVTDIAGTTRDTLKEQISIDGMPIHIIDTAGLRQTSDKVEKLGIAKALAEIQQADRILLMVDANSSNTTEPDDIWPNFADQLPNQEKITVIRNKIDITNESSGIDTSHTVPVLRMSVKTGRGITELRQHLKDCMGYMDSEAGFSARRRHLESLRIARQFLYAGLQQLQDFNAGELVAEDLKEAQKTLGEVTGQVSSDALLGRIFSSFCIGK